MNHAWTPDTDCGRMNGDRTPMPPEHRKLIAASSLGALFEWYDFYLYGALAAVLASRFFAALEPRAALLFALLAFAAGFVVRPLGALLFGRLGDLIGRKYTFLVTLLLMGAATFAVGLLPGYETIGVAAPALLVVLRLLQGPGDRRRVRRRRNVCRRTCALRNAAASTPAGSRPPRRSACCSHCSSSSACAPRSAKRRSPAGAGGCRSCCRSCCVVLGIWMRLSLQSRRCSGG